jgi:hypothetical protein
VSKLRRDPELVGGLFGTQFHGYPHGPDVNRDTRAARFEGAPCRSMPGRRLKGRPLRSAHLVASAAAVGAIEVFVRGRGLQILAKRALAGHPDLSPLRQVQWLSTHQQLIADALAEGLT